MRVFISQPMNGKTDAEIENERKRAIESVKALYPDKEIEVIDNFAKGAQNNANPLCLLAKSIELLATADLAYFAKGWVSARGCLVEHECAILYGIKVLLPI